LKVFLDIVDIHFMLQLSVLWYKVNLTNFGRVTARCSFRSGCTNVG